MASVARFTKREILFRGKRTGHFTHDIHLNGDLISAAVSRERVEDWIDHNHHRFMHFSWVEGEPIFAEPAIDIKHAARGVDVPHDWIPDEDYDHG